MSQTILCCPKCGFPLVYCTCKPVTLDDIKRDARHDEGCKGQSYPNPGMMSVMCNCSRRDKIALLERLQEPTRGMLYAAFDAGGGPEFERAYKAAFKAAEEAK